MTTGDVKNIVVKVGTSILTKNGRFDRSLINSLADQLAGVLNKKISVSIVSSGAIGAGMTLLKEKERPKTMEGLQAAAAVGQRYLMQCYEEAFSKKGYSTAQVLLTWDDMAHAKRFLNAKRTLKEIQRRKLVPIINENDTVATDEIRFGDNDRLSALLSILVEADLLIILSDTNGLFSDGGKGERIKVVNKMDAGVFAHVKDSRTSFTVGGMKSKLEAVSIATTSGIPVYLADGREKDILSKLFKGADCGTRFLPSLKRGQARKDWIYHFLNHAHFRSQVKVGAKEEL
jgi:glutamate 5-kinase